MAEINTSDTDFAAVLNEMTSQNILAFQRNALRWMQPGAGLTAKIVKGTNIAKWASYGDLSTTGLNVGTEGVANTPVDFTIGYQTLSVTQYMRSVRLTDVALDESPHDLLAIASERIARNAVEAVDNLIATSVVSGANVALPNGRVAQADLEDTDILTASVVRKVVSIMKKANIPTFPDGTYHAMVDPSVIYDLQADTSAGGWLEASKYAQPENILSGEIGKFAGVRFIETNVGTEVDPAGGVDNAPIYQTTFFGPEYFAFGDLQTVRSYLVLPGGDHDDPAAQAALVSWKGMYGVKVLGEADGSGPVPGYRHIALRHTGTIAF